MISPNKGAELTREIAYPELDQFPPHRISADPDAFGSVATKTLKQSKKTDKKLNLRVRKEDNVLLQALAEQSDVSKSVLLNQLLHEILLDTLNEIEDVDARALLAREADSRASYDALERPWCVDVGGSFAELAVYNAIHWNNLTGEHVQTPVAGQEEPWDELHSDLFKKLSDLLAGKG